MQEENPEFIKSLDEKIEGATQTPTEGEGLGTNQSQPNEPPKSRRRGRPTGSKTNKVAEAVPPVVRPVPPCNEIEAQAWAQVLAGMCNAFVKKPYKEVLNFTEEEFLTITRPGVVVKDYYMPNYGGIAVVITQLVLAAGSMGFAKYRIIQDIMEKENGKRIGPTGNADGRGSLRGNGVIEAVPGAGGHVAATRQDSAAVERKEDNSDNGNPGNGQIYTGAGTREFTPPDINL